MRQVPAKITLTGAPIKGLKNMSEIQVINAKLLPNHANATQEYTPRGQNRIQFRIPSYSGCWLDTSRSFISYKFNVTGTGITATSAYKLIDTPGAWVDTLTIKNSSGLVLEQITNYNVLQKNMRLASTVEESSMIDQGNYSSVKDTTNKIRIGYKQNQIITSYIFKINTGILSHELKSYLPLSMMDGNGSFALDVEFKLADNDYVLEYWQSSGSSSNGAYVISDVVYNLCLLKLDQSIMKKYDQIATDENDKSVIPFTTYHNHQSSITSKTNTVFVSDNASDLRRLYSVFVPTVHGMTANEEKYKFLGSCGSANDNKITSYNYKVGNTHVFNEDVMEVENNNVSLNHFLQAHYAQNKNTPSMYVAKLDLEGNVDVSSALLAKTAYATNFERDNFVICANFTYSPESDKNVIQGISTNLPITAVFKFQGTPNLVNQNYAECGYSLVIKNGEVTYVENNLDGGFSV